MQAAGGEFGQVIPSDPEQDQARLTGRLPQTTVEVAQRGRIGKGSQGERRRGEHGRRALQAALDRGKKLLERDGFFEVVDGADAGGFRGGVDGAVAGHHHDRHGELPGGGPFLEEGYAIGVRHPDVEQHHVGAGGVARRARGGGVFSQDYVVTFIAQDLGEQFADADFVVNNE